MLGSRLSETIEPKQTWKIDSKTNDYDYLNSDFYDDDFKLISLTDSSASC